MRSRLTADSVPRLSFLLLALCTAVCLPVAAQEANPAPPGPAGQPAVAAPAQAPAQPAPTTEASSGSPSVPAAVDANLQPTDAAAPPLPVASEPAAAEAPDAQPASPPAAAENGPAAAAAPKEKTLPHDLSPWGMFQAADIVVKVVMLGLALASFVTWTVWLAKVFELHVARHGLSRAYRSIRAAASLDEAFEDVGKMRGIGPYLVREAVGEMQASKALLDHGSAEGIKERVTSRLSRAEADAGRRLTLGTGVLATIGATAPFVGLFGTVWGIMNSFIGISETQTTNLAVVAPGIAEALLATAIGLVAAIPAVIIYTAFARSIAGYRLQLANAPAAIERLVSRDLDLRRLSRKPVSLSLAAE